MMLVIVNPYHRSVTIDGEEVVQKILEFPNTLNHLSTISCTYDDEQKKITKVHDLHRFTSNFIQREYFFDNLPVFVEWYYAEKQAQTDEEVRQAKYKEDVENAINQTVQAGIDAQANIATDKTNALNAIASAHTTATNSITSKRAEALNVIQNSKSESLNNITETTNNSVSSVTSAMNTALNNISTERTSAVTAISNDKADALAAISTDRRTSLEEINNSINKATTQADRAKSEADRAKTYSDSMAAVANSKPATKEEIGLVIIGENITVNEEGIINVPNASNEVTGVIKLGEGLDVDEEGSTFIPDATNISKGKLQVGTNLTVTNGIIDAKIASTDDLGLVKIGDNININNGAISINTATNNTFGLVKIGTNIDNTDGTISIKTATKSDLGLMKVGDNLTIDNGEISLTLENIKDELRRICDITYTRPSLMTSNKTSLTIPAGTFVVLDGRGLSSKTDTVLLLDNVANASTRKGKDIYLFAKIDGTLQFFLSMNKAESNAMLIGGLHCLCADVGTISGHTLSGYIAGDILPKSLWDIKHRPISEPEGMVFEDRFRIWTDIYLQSGTGTSTKSIFGASTTRSRGQSGHEYDMMCVGKQLLSSAEFSAIAEGCNEKTNINGSREYTDTGGHTDTTGRRMISNIGCEDTCGLVWQWLRDLGYGSNQATSWAVDTFTNKGQVYQTNALLAGGAWSHGAICGSFAQYAGSSRLGVDSGFGGRGRSECLVV